MIDINESIREVDRQIELLKESIRLMQEQLDILDRRRVFLLENSKDLQSIFDVADW